jgi:copper chaperone CopZ
MVFLMTGPATNAATLATVWRTMGRRTAIVYLATVAACSLGAGLLLDGLFPNLGGTIKAHIHAHQEPGWMQWLQIVSAAALLAMLGHGLIGPLVRRRLHRGEPAAAKESEMKLKITGMTCSHCARSVRQALLEGKGVTDAKVDLAAGLAAVDGADLDADALCAVVRELGYEAERAE